MSDKSNDDKKYLTVEELLNKFKELNKEFIKDIERREKLENNVSPEKIAKEIELDLLNTKIKKEAFIKEIKNGLGEEIIRNNGEVKRIKTPLYMKIKNFLIKLFNVLPK